MVHVGGHYDHMHVRFYTPWSTKAARVAEEDEQQRTAIETAQQAYLPQRVNDDVKGNEQGLEELARSFGVNQKDLCRWSHINPNDPLTPGSCLVFYKRSFEVEPVHLARSLQPDSVPDSPGLQFASGRRRRLPRPTFQLRPSEKIFHALSRHLHHPSGRHAAEGGAT